MKKTAVICLILSILPVCVFAACPVMNCPTSHLTPIVYYDFENNLDDSSGHNLDAVPQATCVPLYYENVGGRPGFSIGNFMSGGGCGIVFPTCTLLRNEGEFEWYQYVTATADNSANVPCTGAPITAPTDV